MLTFLEFYQTFLSFINYRLYTSINLVYPPKLDIDKDDAGAGLSAYLIQSTTDQQSVQPDQPVTNPLPVKDTIKQLATLPSKIASLTDTTQDVSSEPKSVDDEQLDIYTSVHPTTILPQPTLSLTETTPSLFQILHLF